MQAQALLQLDDHEQAHPHQQDQQGVPQADRSIAVEPTMDVKNVADAVVYMANLPLSANVPFMTVMATKMPYIGRG